MWLHVMITPQTKVEELEVTVRGKQDEIKQLASELDRQPPSSLPQQSSQPPPPPPPPSSSARDVSLQTSFSPSPEKPEPSPAPPPSTTDSAAHSATGSKGIKSSLGERRCKSAGRARRIKSPVKRSGALGSGEADVSLDNEMRLVGVELTDSYDSSEGVGFSDTNLDGSSVLLSLDEEGARRELAAGGGRGVSESPQLAWMEGERLGESGETRSEGHGERGRTVGDEEVGSGGSRDITRGSGDLGVGVVREPGEGRAEEGVEGGLQMTELEALARPDEPVSSSSSSDTDLTITHNRPGLIQA